MKKKKLAILTDHSLSFTGFGRFAKALLTQLYSLNKYDIVHFAVGAIKDNPDLDRCPWKTIGVVDPNIIHQLKQANPPNTHEQIDRMSGYGAHTLDTLVKQEKCDVLLNVQDIWGISFACDYYWSDKITNVLWSTIDSRPVLQQAIDCSKKVKHFWSWADFATQDMNKMGLTHVKTVRGCIDTSRFYPLTDIQRKEVRQKSNIPLDSYIILMVGRNQLRKGFPNIIEGYSIFKKDNPTIKNTKLFFHTSLAEGWNLHQLCEQFNVPKNELFTTYVCPHCGQYQVRDYVGQNIDCKFCGIKGQPNQGMVTTSPGMGVTESQLNEIYSLADCYCHVMTSGGQEIPIVESKLCEVPGPTLVTNYSCGEDYCNDPDSGTLELKWSKYLEGNTNFIKSWTSPYDIAKKLKLLYSMDKNERKETAKKGRKWALEKFSPEAIGKTVEELVDNAPFAPENAFQEQKSNANPNFQPNFDEESDEIFLKNLYTNVLGRNFDIGGLNYWMGELSKVS